MEQNIKDLIARLDKIAAKNKDEFTYVIEIKKLARRTPATDFHFICKESQEGHTFVDGHGCDINTAINDATNEIMAACKQWDYKE